MTRLKQKRLVQGLSQEELSFLAGISVRTLQDYEQGHKSIEQAAVSTVYRLAVALLCRIEDIIDVDC